MRANRILFLAIAIAASACANHAIRPADITTHENWPGTENVREYHGIFFSGQPDAEGLKAFKLAGVTTVINLRPEDEMSTLDFDEAAEASELGLEYHAYPWPKKEALQAEAVQSIERVAVEKYKAGEKVLLHCSSGNRAAGWFAVHLRKGHGMSIEDAFGTAKAAGLSRESTLQQVREYLGE